jgi:membrane associated rhomboid family serine protease
MNTGVIGLAYRTYSGGGGSRLGGGGGRYSGGGGRTFSMSFPPFYGAVRMLVLINVAAYFLQLLLHAFLPAAEDYMVGYGQLTPAAVTHGHIYQLITYAFLHSGFFHILFNMLALWMFGAQLEQGWGRRQFYEFYFFTVVGAALITIAVSYTRMLGVTPNTPTVGASGGVFGLLIAFGMLYGDQEVFLFPLPFSMKAKYMVAILVLIAMIGALEGVRQPGQSIANCAPLRGALFGWIYVRFFPRQGLKFLASERYYGVRNSYYKWKRGRAAKKFEVYMRKHDRKDYFDQYGNYKAPDDREKGNGESGRGGWVN